ncbi:TraR/DksA C4-type zinc finger protein [Pseudomonas hormoni]
MKERSHQTIFRYAGYEMRSHSETRWAAVMDALGITWLYESRTVETRHGRYMPDFYLPFAQMFIEVKGPTPTQEEREKAMDAELNTGIPVVFAYGRPELIHAELFHGLLSYYTTKGDATYSTTEVGALVRRYLPLHTYAAFLTAGEHQQRPDFVSVGDALAEIINGWTDRNDREAYMRQLHRPLNQAKAAMKKTIKPFRVAPCGVLDKNSPVEKEPKPGGGVMADIADFAGDVIEQTVELGVAQIPRYTGISAKECECGEEIPEGRRQAIPGVQLCVGCAERVALKTSGVKRG